MKKICILIDNPDRDLDHNILIASKLIKQKFEVIFVEYYKIYEVFIANPDFIILQHCRENYFDLMKACKRIGIKIIVLESEGGYGGVYRFPERFDKYVLKSIKYFDLYFCWGKKHYARIKKKIPKNFRDKIKLTGSPKNDLLHYKYKDYFTSKKNNFILFSTKFPHINPKFTSFKNHYNTVIKTGIATKKKTDDIIKNLYSAQETFINLVLDSSEKLNSKIVVRVHPFENPKLYLQKFAENKKIIISKTGNIIPLLKSAKHLVQYDCQTAFDFYAAGKISISYDKFLNRRLRSFLMSDIKKICKRPNNKQKFFEYLKNRSISANNFNKKYYQNIFFLNDGLSADRICKEVLKLKSNKKDDLNIRDIINKYRLSDKAKISIKMIIGNSKFLKIKKFLKRKHLSDDKILDFKYIKIKIKKLIGQNFKIYYFKNKIFSKDTASIVISQK